MDDLDLDYGSVDPTNVEGVAFCEEMARAIRRRDWAEADALLDRLAAAAGPDAEEQAAKGRIASAVAG